MGAENDMKMKVALISLHTPTATNHGGASALPYHLIKYCPAGVEVEVWSFNVNGCTPGQIADSESELGVKIHVLVQPKKMRWLNAAAVRLLLSRPALSYLSISQKIVDEVNNFLGQEAHNGLWIYGEELAGIANKICGYKTVVTTPDCEALYYLRMFEMPGVGTSFKWLTRYSLMYRRFCKNTAEMPASENITYHLVGKEDAKLFKTINPNANARFVRHPHYDVHERRLSTKTEGKLRLLIAGRYNVYMKNAADEAVESLIKSGVHLSQSYDITFLGKGWENAAKRLSNAGYDVRHVNYVDDYIAEIQRYDLQLTPISVGTGTKGKVLDAIANGLLAIGTPLALENIDVESWKSCIIYEKGSELVAGLERLSKERDLVLRIAEAGRVAVLKSHGRENIAKQVFSFFS